MNLNNAFKLIFIFLLFVPTVTMAYPLMYACDEQGKSILSGKAADAIVTSSSEQANNINLEQLNNSCQLELSQRHFLSSGQKMVTIPGENTLARLAQCSERILYQSQTIDSDKFALFYPNKSNYMPAAIGCNGRLSSCRPQNFSNFKKVIEDAVIMQTDPYALLAVHMMENGNVGNLSLDPVAKISVLGCTGKSSNADDVTALDSFGTFHKFQSKIVKNDILSSLLQTYLSKRKIDFDVKESFYCRNTASAELLWDTEPKDNSCCLKLPFLAKDSAVLDSALTIYFLKKMLATPAAIDSLYKSEPEFRVQKFNGFTNMMGGAEKVPAFRLGVNFYQTPAYGYQVMDYIANALMPSQEIRTMISQAETQFGVTMNHLICIGKPAGNYQIDSSEYFEKHKNSTRLQLLADKYQQGQKIKDLTQREFLVFTSELESEAVQELLGRPMLSARKTLNDFYQSSGITPKRPNLSVSYVEYKNISEIQSDIAQIPMDVLTEDVRALLVDYFSDLISIGSLKKNIDEDNQKIFQMNEFITICSSFSSFSLSCAESGSLESVTYNKKWSSLLSANLAFVEQKNAVDPALRLMTQSVQKKLAELTEKAIKLSQLDNFSKNKINKIRTKLNPQFLSSWNYRDQLNVNKAQTFETYIADLAIPKNREDLVSAAKVQYDGQIFLHKMNVADYWDVYFTQIYINRKTIAQASDYPWRPLLDEEVAQIYRLYKKNQITNP